MRGEAARLSVCFSGDSASAAAAAWERFLRPALSALASSCEGIRKLGQQLDAVCA